jgi:hypothetical protein
MSLINDILYSRYFDDNDLLIDKMGWTETDSDEYGWYQFRLLKNFAADIENLQKDIEDIKKKLGSQTNEGVQ